MEPKPSPFFAINATTVEVTFADDVTEVDKAEFAIDGLAVTNAAIKQSNSKIVVLTTAAQEGAKVYGLTYQGVDTGLTFTGISAVLPTAIKIADGTNFVTVGQQFTVKATVTTTEANKAGIPVTFNIQAPSGSLNQNIIAERLTDANGVAEYTYTRYATDNDAVAVYPTGAAAVRDTRTLAWSAASILAVDTSTTNVIDNNGNKTYTVTVKNQVTGNAVSGQVVRVLFNENIGTINNTTASATDVSNGNTVVPFQRATGNATTLNLTTNSNGQATFTVTGINTTATPIIFIDPAVGGNNRLDAQDIQLWASSVTFQGAQTTSTITLTPDTQATIAASATSGRVYTVEVKKPDGSAFAGGRVQVAFNELIDNNIGTTTNATFVWFDNDSTLRTTTSNGVPAGTTNAALAPWRTVGLNQMEIALNSAGKATFMIANGTQAQVATPIVWIDQDSTVTGMNNHTLETTEPNKLGGVTVTEGQAVTSAKLDVDQATQASGQDAVVTYTVLDQNGVAYLPATDGNVRVTYTIANTGTNPLNIARTTAGVADGALGGLFSINGAADAAFGIGANLVTVNPGMTATVAVTLDRTTGQNTKIALWTGAGAGTSYSISAQGLTLTTNRSLPVSAITGTFTDAVSIDTIVTAANQNLTGTITAFDTADADYEGAGVGQEQSGRVIVSVDGQPGVYAWFTYGQGLNGFAIGATANDNLLVGTDSAFNGNTPANNAQFESALSVGNKVRFTAPAVYATSRLAVDGISLYNLNNTNVNSQVNQTLPLPAPPVLTNYFTAGATTTGVTAAGTAGTVAVDVNGVASNLVITKPISATTTSLNGTTFVVEINTIDTLTATKVGNTVTIKLANTTAAKNTNLLITGAVQALLGNFADVTVGGAFNGTAVPTVIGNGTQTMNNGVNLAVAVAAVQNYTLNGMFVAGNTVTVVYDDGTPTTVTLVAGTDFAIGGTVAAQAINIAAALDTALNAEDVTVNSPAPGVIRLTQDPTFERPVTVTVTSNPAQF